MAEETELYLLDWQETAHGKQPTADEVLEWATANGLYVDGMPKVYADGTVQIECLHSPESLWPAFAPMPQTSHNVLAGHVRATVAIRAELRAIPEYQRSPVERGLLAVIALLMHGYGVEDD